MEKERKNTKKGGKAKGSQTVWKRKDGRWEGRYKVYCPEKGKPVYRSVYGRSRKETVGKLQGRAEREEECKKFSLTCAAEGWLEETAARKKHSTYVKYRLIYHKYLKELFFNRTILDIGPKELQSRLPEDLSISTQKSVYCVLKQILRYGAEIYSMPMPEIEKPYESKNRKTIEIFSIAEQAKLLDLLYQEADVYKNAALLCLYMGIRLGEICALKWQDVDFANRIVQIRRTVQRIYADGGLSRTVLMESEPKSVCSMREIPLPDKAAALLSQIKGGGEYVFGGKKPLEPRTLQKRFQKMLEEAGLPHKKFHILRHTFATNCVESGMDVKSLSEILGHSDVKITLNRYVHPTMRTKHKHMNELSAFYGQIHGQAV